ncbi:TolC family outer membrane protein [Marinobacterium arenosum]|uniref:TolC family outer membrane protein n=1 Tax=Marinobacterium arenosum TaxID=2862496 RepID=UPI001C94A627|nr:TolC family outer membrane protein [Marinobacterium arenosum]MBY4675569.1 TolC family outer membrane protein [Marinobacterium arenosum]
MMIKKLKSALSLFCLCTYLPAAQAETAELAEVIGKALARHPDVLRAQAQTVEGERRLDAARASYLPSLDITGDIGAEQVNNATTRARNEQDDTWERRRLGFEARQMLFDGFNTQYEVERNEHFTEARQLELAAVRENVALRVAQAYLDLQKQRALYGLAAENLANHEEIYSQIRSRVDQGVGTRADLSQISSRLNSANANLVSAENNLVDAETDYQRVVGALPPDTLTVFELDETLLPETLEEAERQAVTENYTVQASVVDIDEARSQYKRSKSNYYPQLDLVVGGDYGEEIGGTAGVDESYSVLLEMRWNLFSGGADKANNLAAAQQVEQARAVNDDAQRQARQGVRLSWAAYDALARQREFLAEYVYASGATRDAYRKEFNLGKRTLIDLLDAENEVFRSNSQYMDAYYTYEAAKVRILNAIGKLTSVLLAK